MRSVEVTAAEITDELKEIAALESEVEQEMRLKRLSDASRVGRSILKKELKKITSLARSLTSSAVPLHEISIDDDRAVEHICADVVGILRDLDVHRYGGNLARLVKKDDGGATLNLISKPEEMQGLLVGVVEFSWMDNHSKIHRGLLPRDIASALPHSDKCNALPVIRHLTDIPILNKDFEPLVPGYNQDEQIFVSGPAIYPAGDISTIERLLKGFCFKSLSDRANFFALLLTILVHHHDELRARVPILNAI